MQPSRRPTDGRYGENPNRLQHYYQFQVILKPSPPDIQELYLGSLEAIGIDTAAARHPLRRGRLGEPDARRLGPRLGSLVRRHGGHASSPTSSRSAASTCDPVSGELTYGLERLAMYLFDKKSIYDLPFNDRLEVPLTYGDVFLQNEREQSAYNFEHADTEMLFRHFADAEKECGRLIEREAAAAGLRPVHQGQPHCSTCWMRAA